MLEARGLRSSYGKSQVLHGVDPVVKAGQVVSLMGRNGMGKTTTLRALIGLNAPDSGSITYAGVDVSGWAANRISTAGIGWVPEGRRIFPTLTVTENLAMAARSQHSGYWTIDSVFGLFPPARARRQFRQHFVRRRAADAGDRTRPDD